ncbi:DeoR/GlpR family DNA-binding transcription regulator [Mediterraneibacter massiliensis]|uniref:DeoR/GlpR family DNA-binding transcription regulator n=1 Tax=Mediterraneibacter massiliensis TaxID=1720300 RepID=UPI0024ADA281|nr:DeoR/GlpR family DNA-binding transcription regulator [Mediterraneibacter massiliensis]
MGKKEKRLEEMLQELRSKKTLKISDIETLFHVSESTARRMCTELEHEGKGIRTLGGIQYLPEQYTESLLTYSFDSLAQQYIEEKQAIAAYASSLIVPGDTLFLSGGTTVYQLACKLSALLAETPYPQLEIMTNSIANAEILSSASNVILTGGEYRPARRDTAGIAGEKAIANARFSKAFIGLDAIDIRDGLMAWDIDTARIDHLAIKHSNHVYLLVDSSKFSQKTFVNYEELVSDYTIITDKNIPSEIYTNAKHIGQSIVIV